MSNHIMQQFNVKSDWPITGYVSTRVGIGLNNIKDDQDFLSVMSGSDIAGGDLFLDVLKAFGDRLIKDYGFRWNMKFDDYYKVWEPWISTGEGQSYPLFSKVYGDIYNSGEGIVLKEYAKAIINESLRKSRY